MTLPVQLDHETEQILREQAAHLRTDPEALAADIIRRALSTGPLPEPPGASLPRRNVRSDSSQAREARRVRFEAAMRTIEDLNDRVPMPVLPEEAFTTESFYAD